MTDDKPRFPSLEPSVSSGGSSFTGDDAIRGGARPQISRDTIQKKAEQAQKALVCTECEIVLKYRDDWGHCPKCGDELLEVDRE